MDSFKSDVATSVKIKKIRHTEATVTHVTLKRTLKQVGTMFK